MRSGSILESVPLEVDGKTYTYHHLTVDIAPLPLLHWLNEQTLYPKVYWQQRCGQVERAAVGCVMTLPHVPELGANTPPHVRFFGGKQFGSQPISSTWDPFPECAFWLPQFEVVQEPGRTYLLIHDLSEEPNSGVMQQLNFEIRERTQALPNLKERRDVPSLDHWELLIARALYQIEEGLLEKVVLARKTHYMAQEKLDPFILLDFLKKKALKSALFGFQLTEDAAFIGSTPEQLYRRQGLHLQTDALAGTRPRGNTEEENLRIQEELLTNLKEKREFSFVKQFIQTALEPLCTEMHWDPYDRVVPTTHVQHIHNKLMVLLKPEITDRKLIDTLHPTPALGGKPRAEALEFLMREEPFDRGWYGAPLGWISSQEADIAVGIRSALIRGQELELFAGTGIVKGSQALREWEELEHKITPFKQLFL
jgi:menaquinone-specific isochorismate synthase